MKNTNYFGRICRFLGRINLFIGFILCIGIGALLLSASILEKPLIRHNPDSNVTSTTSHLSPKTSHTPIINIFQNQFLSWLLVAIIIAATAIAIAFLAYRYNATIRKLIASLAKHINFPIHIVELSLALLIWSPLLIMLIFSFPYAATFFIFSFIINELLFIFAWASYGMPDYIV